jgi:hypothetical protein
MMVFENMSLEEIIKRNVDFKIKDLKVDDPKDEKILDRLEQLAPDMIIRMRVTPEVGRDRFFTMRVKIDENMTASLLGHPAEGFRNVQPMEDVTKYMPQTMSYAEQIVEALNKALEEKRKQKPNA